MKETLEQQVILLCIQQEVHQEEIVEVAVIALKIIVVSNFRETGGRTSTRVTTVQTNTTPVVSVSATNVRRSSRRTTVGTGTGKITDL